MSKLVKYSKEFKVDALNLLQEGKRISDISKSLGISVNVLCTWRRRYQLHGDKALDQVFVYLRMNNRKNSGILKKKSQS